jgi:hypothetical protein
MTKRRLIIGLVVYLFLWCVTWILGEMHISSRFDGEFVDGTKATFADGLKKYPMEKTKRITRFDVTRVDGGLGVEQPELPWKYRSSAVALAPFILVDKCAYGTSGLCGWGGVRLHIWVFGLTHWWPIIAYWAA